MANKDTITKDYMQDKKTFADAFNFLIYNGEQIIKPEHLKPHDTTSIALPYGEDNKPIPIQRYRDILKIATIMEDDNATYLLLGIENQSQINYAMPVRNMLYDALQYVDQVDNIARAHRLNDKMPETRAEFLSGFYKTDHLLPVITLTIYFGTDKWDAQKSLYDMFSVKDKRLLKFVANYKLDLIAPAEIADEEFKKFHTELSLALKYIKYSKDRKRLKEIIQEDIAYKAVSKKTVDMLNVITNSGLRYNDGEENVNMCEAIEGIREDARAEGRAEGKAEGELKVLINLVKKGILTLTQAAEEANLTVPEFEEKTGLKT